MTTDRDRKPIAIVGMACRLPGGISDLDQLWRLLEDGDHVITEVPEDRWDVGAFFSEHPGAPGKMLSRWGGFVPGITDFDPGFFGISPREAACLDPQHRWLLEVAWEALEDAGLDVEQLAGEPVGVFVGASTHDFSILQSKDPRGVDVHSTIGTALCMAANRISYAFDLRGPSLVVDTACSSSLTACHLACQSLWSGESSLALVGGVNALLAPDTSVSFSRASLLSPSGRCRVFDERADGYVRSEGAGVLVLKPWQEAVAAADRVYAVIRSTAANQDGRTGSIAVPGLDSQVQLLRQAYEQAGIAPETVSVIEAHGTGTPTGDPIELAALAAVLGAQTRSRRCVVGSIKANIGHLEAGAGAAGLIKAALMVWRRRVVPQTDAARVAASVALDGLGLEIATAAHTLGDGPWIAGVSSFGLGGANAHVVLEGTEDHQPAPAPAAPGPCLLPLSARNPKALPAIAADLERLLDANPDLALRDLAHNASRRRSHHPYRVALAVRTREDLRRELAALSDGRRSSSQRRAAGDPAVVFVFTGQGPQWWGMGRGLLELPVFRQVVEQCDELFVSIAGRSLLAEMLKDEADSRMGHASVAQPALFALQMGLTALWRSWGIRPSATVGHSVGEVAAMAAAGVVDLSDALAIVHHRGRLQERTHGGGRMLAAGVSVVEAEQLQRELGEGLELAAVNSPDLVTLSGEADVVAQAQEVLQDRGVFCRPLGVEYAFHSRQMEPLREELLQSLASIRPRDGEVPFYSTVTGGLMDGRTCDSEYWYRNLREPVRLAAAIDAVAGESADAFLEIGPHPVLAGALRGCLTRAESHAVVLGSLVRGSEDLEARPGTPSGDASRSSSRFSLREGVSAGPLGALFRSLGALYELGCTLRWHEIYPGQAPFVRLPGYPWQRQRCWQEGPESVAHRLLRPRHPLLDERIPLPLPAWKSIFDVRGLPYLGEHRIRGRLLCPASHFLAMALAAAEELRSGEAPRLERVELLRPLVIPGEAAILVELVVSQDGAFKVLTAEHEHDGPWTTHAAGRLGRASGGPAGNPSRSEDCEEVRDAAPEGRSRSSATSRTSGAADCASFAIRSREGVSGRASSEQPEEATSWAELLQAVQQGDLGPGRDRADVYDSLERMGYGFGPSFRRTERLWTISEDEAVSKIDPGDLSPGERQRFRYHPCLLDACTHCLEGIPKFSRESRDSTIYLPTRIDSVEILEPLTEAFWVHVRLLEQESADERVRADIHILDPHGRIMGHLLGFELAAVALPRAGGTSGSHYTWEWESLALDEEISSGGGSLEETLRHPLAAAGTWVVLEDQRGFGARIAGLLREQGDRCVMVRPGPRWSTAGDGVVMVPTDASQMRRLVAGAAAGSDELKGILHLWNLDPAAPGEEGLSSRCLAAQQAVASISMLHLVQVLTAQQVALRSRLWVGTSSALGPGLLEGESAVDVASGSAAWGLGRAVATEHPELCCTVFEVDRRRLADSAFALLDEIWSHASEPQVAFQGRSRLVRRLRRVDPATLPVRYDPGVVAGAPVPFRLATHAPGLLGNLDLHATERRPPGPLEVEIRVSVAALNFRDVLKAMGLYPGENAGDYWFGDECVGRVVAVGAEVKDLAVGREVVALASGSLGSYVTTAADLVVARPASLSAVEAATMPVAYLTAYYSLLEAGRLKAGEQVLIHSAAGGVGQAALHIARRVGARVVATAGTEEKREHLRAQGVASVFDSRSPAFADQVMRCTGGRGVDVVLNSLSGELLHRGVDVLAPGGRFVEIGRRDIYDNASLGLAALKRNRSFIAVDLGEVLASAAAGASGPRQPAGGLLARVRRLLSDGTVPPLPHRVFKISEHRQAFHHMARGEHIGKIVLDCEESEIPIRRFSRPGRRFSSDGAFLVVGGTGGFGLEAAVWLADNGARAITLMSRSGVRSQAVRSRLDTLREQGVAIRIEKADVTDEHELVAVLERMDEEGPVLRGVIHAAMVLHDALLEDLDQQSFEQVLWPKVLGAWHLHRLTRDRPVELFLLFSSLTSFLPAPGQAAYAAANSFLDGLACYRQARGLPALSVSWGLVSDAGLFVRRPDLKNVFTESMGFIEMKSRRALELLGPVLDRDTAQIGVFDVDWTELARASAAVRSSPQLSEVLEQERQGALQTDPSGLRAQLRRAPEAEAHDMLCRHIQRTVARVLGLDPSEVELDVPLPELGLDSLMAFQIMLALDRDLGTDLQPARLSQSPSVVDVARYLLPLVRESEQT